MDYNYFEVLELSIDDFQDKDEATIKDLVNTAHTKLYALTIGAYANTPRPDGLTQAQWQKVLNDAKDTLLDPRKRREHIADLMPEAESTQTPERNEIPEVESTHPEHKWRMWIALCTVQLLIAIFLWTWLHHAMSTGDSEGILLTLLITGVIIIVIIYRILLRIHKAGIISILLGSRGIIRILFYSWEIIRIILFFRREVINQIREMINEIISKLKIKIEGLEWEFALGSAIILGLPWVFALEHISESDSYYVSLFFHPLFIICALLFRIGFIQYCFMATYNFVQDYSPVTSIVFLSWCAGNKRWWSLIAIFAGTLAGVLVPYGIRTEFFYRLLVKLGFVSSGISVTSVDFVTFDFLIHCLVSLMIVVPFVRGVVYKKLRLMIKRLILIWSVILALYLAFIFAEIFDSEAFLNSLVFLPAALLAIFYYTVGYIRYTRYLAK